MLQRGLMKLVGNTDGVVLQQKPRLNRSHPVLHTNGQCRATVMLGHRHVDTTSASRKARPTLAWLSSWPWADYSVVSFFPMRSSWPIAGGILDAAH